jgi:peptidoglycan/LPS O-acetylase OafA/YrhL
LPGLDGLRAIAVLAVMVFHFFPGVLRGGFVGVDIFFVVSGFLITTILLRDVSRHHRVELGGFWGRRARRLLPALFTMLLVCSSATLLVGGDTALALGRQLLGAVTFSSNWVSIGGGASYFTQDSPELFRNLWSLAVEEQFYVLWPFVVWLLARTVRARTGAWICALMAVLSAGAMAVFFQGGDPTRVYFGTDTHSFGLMIGSFLAFAMIDRGRDEITDRAAALRRPAPWIGIAALALIVIGAVVLGETDAVTYRGGLLAISLLTAVVIWSVVRSAWLGGVLDARPLRAVGRRSYGLYLWHWPVFVLVAAAIPPSAEPWRPVAIGVIAAVVSFAAAWISFSMIETPFLSRRGTAAATLAPDRARQRLTVALGALLAVVLVTTTGAAVVAAPQTSQAQQAVQRGIDALARNPATASPAPRASSPVPSDAPSAAMPSPSASTIPLPTPVATSSPSVAPVSPTPSTRPSPPPAPTPVVPVSGGEISAVGDSVMLASAGALPSTFPGISINAVVSRQPRSAPDLLSALARAGQLRRVVVLGLGTNGYWGAGTLERVVAAIGPDRILVLVSVYAPRQWTQSVNDYSARIAAAHPRQVALAPWAALIAKQPGLLGPDGIHPGPRGGAVYAQAVEDGLAALK